MSKSYGLIIPGKNKMVVQAPGKSAAIFNEDSDSDESSSTKPVFRKPMLKKPIQLAQEKAIEEDPTVYQYDEVYDDMQKQRNEHKLLKKGVDKKPKYIANLLKAAERRKRENEQRIERQVQKERETEGDEFKDKESFITPSYLKKLEEIKQLEEQEKREEYLEAIGDVTKQGNLDGFYRHFYDQKVNFEENEKKKEETEVQQKSKDEEIQNDKITKKKSVKRHYRQREDSESEDDVQDVKKEHLPSNLDADSDFSIDSSDSEEENSKKLKLEESIEKDEEVAKKDEPLGGEKENNEEKPNATVDIEEIKNIEEPIHKKPKIDIYKKRTVGEAFENAKQRYLERKALRQGG